MNGQDILDLVNAVACRCIGLVGWLSLALRDISGEVLAAIGGIWTVFGFKALALWSVMAALYEEEPERPQRIQEVKKHRVYYADGTPAFRSQYRRQTKFKGDDQTDVVSENQNYELACGHLASEKRMQGICPVCRSERHNSGICCEECFSKCDICFTPRCRNHTFPSKASPSLRLCEQCASKEKWGMLVSGLVRGIKAVGRAIFLKPTHPSKRRGEPKRKS